MDLSLFIARALFVSMAILLSGSVSLLAQGKMDRIERERFKSMLKVVKNAVKDEYYDTTFRGIDLEARFAQAASRMDEVQTSGQAMGVIAQALIDFDDSHLFFLPPSTTTKVEYGWRHAIVGDRLFVTLVKPKSDAEAKGLRPGDEIISIEGFKPNKKEIWKMDYYYNTLSKRPSLKVRVLSPGSTEPKDLEIRSKVTTLPRVIDQKLFYQLFDTSGRSDISYNYFKNVGNVAIWKMPTFAIEPSSIDTLMGKVMNSQSLILDLRGNGGGLVDTLERLAGFLFDRDLTIAELKGRKKMDPQRSKTRGDNGYKGSLIVLTDAESGSAAEILARLVQIEKRGKVIGDVSAGAVMQSRQMIFTMGGNDEILYGVSVTNADVIMSDGKSIEHVGVIPDEPVNPTGEDLAAKRDPVLAKALKMAGVEISAADAGKFFQYTWKEGQNGRELIEIDVN